MRKCFKVLSLLLAGTCLLSGLIPLLFFRVFHTGVLAVLLLGGLLLALCLCWDFDPMRRVRIRRSLREVSDRRRPPVPRWWRRFRAVCAAGIGLCLLGAAALSVMMLNAAADRPGEGVRTVVVLGCQIRGDQPSRMMSHRLDAAARYLAEHPEAPVVVSGGQGWDEEVSEASVMKRVLIERGIEETRIYLEERSSNTSENLRYTKEVIAQNGLPTRVAIATDGFHQLRGAIYARRNGLEPSALASKTPWGLLPTYWMREFFALVKAAFV